MRCDQGWCIASKEGCSLRVRNNLSSITAGRHLNLTNSSLSRSLERLSSGLRINRAGDDAAGLAVSEKLRAQVSGLGVDVENAQNGISMVQTADQALQEVQSLVRRIRNLSHMCANGTLTDQDREHYQSETDSLLTEIQRINNTTEYNGMRLLGGRIGTWAKESGDNRDILDASSLRTTDDLITSGVYDVEVLRVGEKATARLEGKVFDVTDPPLDIHEAGGFYRFAGADQDGTITLKVTVDGKEVFVDINAREGAGDSLTEAVGKINRALKEEGIDVSAHFTPPNDASNITTDTSSVLPEPLETTVPLAWQNPAPFNWTRSGPKIYDPGGNPIVDSTFTIDFTSPSAFTVTGDVSGDLGTGTTGVNFNNGGLSFRIQPDGDLSAGDRIVLTPGERTVTINSNSTNLTDVSIPMDSTIGDGNHTVTVTSGASVTGWNFQAPGVGAPGWITAPTPVPGNNLTNETFTLELIEDHGGPNDIWSVTGSFSRGNLNYRVGGAYTTAPAHFGRGSGLTFSLSPDAGYSLGDTITIDTISGSRPVALDTDSTPTDAVYRRWFTIDDDTGNHANVIYGTGSGWIVAGADTITIDTQVDVDATHLPDTMFQAYPALAGGSNNYISQTYYLTLTTDNDGPDVWAVAGSFSGTHQPATAGVPYVSDAGSNGSDQGLSFTLAQDSKFHVGSVLAVQVYTRPSIGFVSHKAGSRYAIDLEIVGDSCITQMETRSTDLVYTGGDPQEIGINTTIYDLDGNPFNDLGYATGTILITDKAGVAHSVTVSLGDTIWDLLEAINATGSFYASFDEDDQAISIKDLTNGDDKLTVADVGNATLAADLGIRGDVSGDTFTGHTVSRVANTILEITDPDGSTATINGGWHGGDQSFEAVGNPDQVLTDSSSENQGGIAGLSFSLNDKQLKEGDTFSIQAGKGTLNLQISQSKGGDGRAGIEICDTSLSSLGLSENVSMGSQETAQALIDSGKLDQAMDYLSTLRGGLGAFQNRLGHTVKNLGITRENLQSAESRIRDADMAQEQLDFMKHKIMQQFGIAAGSQANVLAENVLRLLQ